MSYEYYFFTKLFLIKINLIILITAIIKQVANNILIKYLTIKNTGLSTIIFLVSPLLVNYKKAGNIIPPFNFAFIFSSFVSDITISVDELSYLFIISPVSTSYT